MKVIKPQKLSLLTRCIEFKQKFRMGVSILMHVPLGEKADLYSEVSLWKLAAEQLGKGAAVDAAIPKLVPEFLVHGIAHPPGGAPAPACAVRARFGDCEKKLLVFGDRHWHGSTTSAPQPFTDMPLNWSAAFGGAGYAANPVGKGMADGDAGNDQKRIALPNVEHPEHRVVRPQDRPPEPAGFGAIDQTWPQRAAKAGTYDAAWLKSDFPAYARDIDWRFFNLAPADQWLRFPLAVNEHYEFENLHPGKPLIAGQLPGFQARCLVNRDPAEPALETVPMRLGTVWFFPHIERAILVYQGFVDVVEEDGADIHHIVVAAEHADQPKPAGHYQDVLNGRLDKDKGALKLLRDGDLLPSDLGAADTAQDDSKTLLSGQNRLRQNIHKRRLRETERVRAEVASYGLDPDEHGPALPVPDQALPDLEHLPDHLDRLLAQARRDSEKAKADAAASVEATAKQFAALGMSFDPVRAELADRPKGPPTFSAKAQLDSLEKLAQGLAADGTAVVELEGYYKDPAFRERLFDAERKMRETYRATAHLQDAALPMATERAQAVHGGIVAALARGVSFAGLDLTGATLSDLDLSGADFSGALLECANFDRSRLRGCNFSDAVLTRAHLHQADLSGSNCSGANLALIECNGTRFDDANLGAARLEGAILVRTSFQRANLTGAECSKARFEDTDWTEVQAPDMVFMDTDLRGLRLVRAHLEKSTFLRCDLRSVDFSGAQLEASLFLTAQGAQATFAGARLVNLRCVEACDFSHADFSGADMTEANLRGCLLAGAQLIGTKLPGADLSEAKLNTASFYLAMANGARMVKADLRNAVFVSANLMDAVLQRSNILGADFRLANLFQADFARVKVDHSVQFAHALMKRTRTVPRLAAPAS
ncbi:MAG: DUF2169 domain-containing protein [Panacagrimonas sp.]